MEMVIKRRFNGNYPVRKSIQAGFARRAGKRDCCFKPLLLKITELFSDSPKISFDSKTTAFTSVKAVVIILLYFPKGFSPQ